MKRSTKFSKYQYGMMASLYFGCVLTIIYFTWDMKVYSEMRKPHRHRKPLKGANKTPSVSLSDDVRRVLKHYQHVPIHRAESSTLKLPSIPLISVVWDLMPDKQHSTYRYMSVYLKTLAFFNTKSINIVFMMNQGEETIKTMMDDWPSHYRERLNITAVPEWSGFQQRERSLHKLPLQRIFPLLDAAVITNLDTIFLRSLPPLLEEFDKMASAEVVGSSKSQSGNSGCGLWLLNLTKMRDLNEYYLANPDSRDKTNKEESAIEMDQFHTVTYSLPEDWNFDSQVCKSMSFSFNGICALQGCEGSFLETFTDIFSYFETFVLKDNHKVDVELFLRDMGNKNISSSRLCQKTLEWESLITYYPKQFYSKL